MRICVFLRLQRQIAKATVEESIQSYYCSKFQVMDEIIRVIHVSAVIFA